MEPSKKALARLAVNPRQRLDHEQNLAGARLCNFRRAGHDPDQVPYNPRRATRDRLHAPGFSVRSPFMASILYV
jgi:hypothetical protein